MAERDLKIKTSVVRRQVMIKEVASYQKEAEGEKKRLEQFIAEGKDEYQIKQQKKVLQQSEDMIPDSQQRMSKAVNELRDLVSRYKEELHDSQAYKDAEGALEDAAV
ncbi:tubulin binding cofactor A [Atractiella rhizophila]|nr:tubulin binding cofactor A [Atractiella rhizophila]